MPSQENKHFIHKLLSYGKQIVKLVCAYYLYNMPFLELSVFVSLGQQFSSFKAFARTCKKLIEK